LCELHQLNGHEEEDGVCHELLEQSTRLKLKLFGRSDGAMNGIFIKACWDEAIREVY
jgi:hypothetical protein